MKMIRIEEYTKTHDMLKIKYELTKVLQVNPNMISLIESAEKETDDKRNLYKVYLSGGGAFVTTSDNIELLGVSVGS